MQLCIKLILTATLLTAPKYSWISDFKVEDQLLNRIPVPEGYSRVKYPDDSFSEWLRQIPLKKENSPVYLYNKKLKSTQEAHFAVCDIDCGNEDLQQCADAIIRLRAEYLFSQNAHSDIHFNFTSGDMASWNEWARGNRPRIQGNKVSWSKTRPADFSYTNFRKYLRTVFTYAGSASLSKELKSVSEADIQAGDVFIQGGFPGHAVIVMDVAVNKKGERIFLLAQSYMPAQDIHILKNLTDNTLDPWFSADFTDILNTPEWTFRKGDLKRFQ